MRDEEIKHKLTKCRKFLCPNAAKEAKLKEKMYCIVLCCIVLAVILLVVALVHLHHYRYRLRIGEAGKLLLLLILLHLIS